MYYWWHPTPNKTWSIMESSFYLPNNLRNTLLLTSAGFPPDTKNTFPPITAFLLAWKKFTYDPSHTLQIPLRMLTSHMTNLNLQHWLTHGIDKQIDLYANGSLKTLSKLNTTSQTLKPIPTWEFPIFLNNLNSPLWLEFLNHYTNSTPTRFTPNMVFPYYTQPSWKIDPTLKLFLSRNGVRN